MWSEARIVATKKSDGPPCQKRVVESDDQVVTEWAKSCVPQHLVRLQRALLSVERSLALLEHCLPDNYSAQVTRCENALRAGRVVLPEFRYRPVSGAFLHAEQALLCLRSPHPGGTAVWNVVEQLLHERAEELQKEAQIVRARGSQRVPKLAGARFPFTEQELHEADELSNTWLVEWSDCDALAWEDVQTHDLLQGLAMRARREGLAVRIVVREIATTCAVSEDGLVVARGPRVPAEEIERLWVHEVLGHWLPRQRARSMPPPFAAGTKGASEDEEGRALLLEERYGALGARRKLDLALRHQLARAILSASTGDALEQLVLSLLERAVPIELLARALCRNLRGGGLGREVIYLPAYLRVKRAFAEAPYCESLLAAGRISVEGALRLHAVLTTDAHPEA